MAVISNPPNKLRIKEIFAFVSEDEHGDEGICAFSTPAGMMPMIGADPERIEDLRPIAKLLAGQKQFTNKGIKLIKFTVREDLEVIQP